MNVPTLFGKSILLFLASVIAAMAQSKPDPLPFCPLSDAQDNCVRILACVGQDGHYFHGRAFGRGTGTLAGVISNGATCTGNWKSRNALGFGQADVSCDDGMKVRVIYTYQEEYTGTAIGRGIANDGTFVKAWSGLHVFEYLQKETGLPNGVLLCGSQSIPIS